MTELTQRMRLILALLKVFGPQPTNKIALIVYAGQSVFLGRQLQSLQSTLRKMQAMNLITFLEGSEQWSLPLP